MATEQRLSEMRGEVQRTSTSYDEASNAFKDFPYVLERGGISGARYERWSDGFIRQWGVLENVTLTETWHAVTFAIPFITGAEFALATVSKASGSSTSGTTSPVVQKPLGAYLDKMYVMGDHYSASGNGDILWEVTGY